MELERIGFDKKTAGRREKIFIDFSSFFKKKDYVPKAEKKQ